MLFYLLFRIISATTAFLYPGYASYKTLSQRPANEAELERWLMYWSVLGCIIAVESVAEWLVSWLPFYYFFKTVFLLYLALPQTSGSAWLYQTQLRPFLAAHENQIDSALAQLKVYLYSSFQRLLRRGWEQVSGVVSQAPSQSTGSSLLEEDNASNTGASSSNESAAGPAQLMAGLWGTYGPSLLASGAALITQAQVSAAQAAANANASAQASRAPRNPGGAEDRRRQLEAELASLGDEHAGYDVSSVTSSPAFVAVQIPPDNGKSTFEEVDVPSDMEPEEGHPISSRPDQKSTSWFGWGAANAGYERVKDN